MSLFHEIYEEFQEVEGGLLIARHQEISPEFIQRIADVRHADTHARCGTYHEVCSIPEITWEIWVKQGHDPSTWTAKDFIKKLRADNLDCFISTSKNV